MEDCIFCKIANGDIPAAKVYEDDEFVAIVDIAPVNKGHCLVIPKKHSKNIMDIDEETLKKAVLVIQKIAKAIKQAVGADGINIGMNNEKAAGQLVMHTHFHIIPRKQGDGLDMWPGGKYEEGEIDKIAEKIKEATQ